MMGLLWHLKITHTPTGESITVDSNNFRSMHKGKEAAIKALKARIYAKYNLNMSGGNEIAVYNLPNNNEYPNDLADYRVNLEL